MLGATLIREAISRMTATLPLAAALADLDIEVFSRTSVEQYKKEKLASTMANLEAAWAVTGWLDITKHHASLYPVSKVLGGDWSGADARWLSHPSMGMPRLVALKWFRSGVMHGLASADINGVLPDHINRKICQITSSIPGVTFETDTLRTQDTPYDPFLIAKYGDEEYYIEVWGDDDKEFQR